MELPRDPMITLGLISGVPPSTPRDGSHDPEMAPETPSSVSCAPTGLSVDRSMTLQPEEPGQELPSLDALAGPISDAPTGMDFFDLSGDAYLDLDLLDWGIFDNSFVAQQDPSQLDTTSPETSQQMFVSPEATTIGSKDLDLMAPKWTLSTNLPDGMSLMQISPLESHRNQILQYLQGSENSRRFERWFSIDNMSLFLISYFKNFHQHTPLIHLPFWTIAGTSSRLVFAMCLMGAIYSGDLKTNGSQARKLCQAAQTFAWTADPGLKSGGAAQLDTIQAVYIVTLLEAFYLPFKAYRPPMDLKRLVNEARNAGIFNPVNTGSELEEIGWKEWSTRESRVRSACCLPRVILTFT